MRKILKKISIIATAITIIAATTIDIILAIFFFVIFAGWGGMFRYSSPSSPAICTNDNSRFEMKFDGSAGLSVTLIAVLASRVPYFFRYSTDGG